MGVGMFQTGPDYLVPLGSSNPKAEKSKRKLKPFVEKSYTVSKRLRDDGDPGERGLYVGGGSSIPKHECLYCEKKYSRQWTLDRHMKTHPEYDEDSDEDEADSKKGDESESETEDDDNKEKSESDAEEDDEMEVRDDDEIVPKSTVNCLLHMIGAADIGKLDLSTSALRCFVTKENSKDEEDENTDTVGPNVIRFLKEMLIAVKVGDITLKKSLYQDILDAVDQAAEDDD
jgi:hypothetical protein